MVHHISCLFHYFLDYIIVGKGHAGSIFIVQESDDFCLVILDISMLWCSLQISNKS